MEKSTEFLMMLLRSVLRIVSKTALTKVALAIGPMAATMVEMEVATMAWMTVATKVKMTEAID